MEAAINDKPEPGAADLSSTLFNILQDERKVRAVLARAEGKSWKEVAAAAGVERTILWMWRYSHPIDQLVAQLVLQGVKSAVVRITANAEDAADVVSAHLKGEVDPDMIEVERLKSAAAKTTLGVALKLAEKAAEMEQERKRVPPSVYRPVAALPDQSPGKAAAERLRKR